ncbi:3,4-dihydroxy-2-butanone-4-phosphate synthase [Actinomyces gaoshouyii]|uniref:GTP cyclohydrolase-2 n=1 Tax=Actinomyces gaoshouyii TaxID=1960083 RepID=A0A8H9HBP8_9ACTO|nr:3,4-dihydroxy-2-butanone-4-phosphate synthase [Actinomyces gaoshouyii]GGO95241.1 GTP cyclohydrolase-2 [Actinomyces gaoshouyii]
MSASAIPAGFDDVVRAVEQLAAGRPVIVTDDADRENEGDLIAAGGLLTAQTLGFLVRHTSGYICSPMTRQRARSLGLDLMVPDNQDPRGTAYTVSCDAASGVTTGISAADRALTIRTLADPDSTATSLHRPGHVLPLIARAGGVLERPGHTEAAVDLCRLAGLEPVAAIGEIVDDAGALMRVEALRAFSAEHGLTMLGIDRLAACLRGLSAFQRSEAVELPTDRGVFEAIAWSRADAIGASESGASGPAEIAGAPAEHLSLAAPGARPAPVPLVRLHSECLTGDVFASHRCDCGQQLDAAMARVQAEGGAVIYLRGHEGRGIGLVNKLRAYHLQSQGADTVEANELLGLPGEAREWRDAADILAELGLRRIRLLTNNPLKVEAMRRAGIDVVGAEPLEIPARPQNLAYLRTKRDRMNHALTHLS